MCKSVMVSIVMPVFNARKYIDDAIQSILRQTYSSYELIIIDDGATDGTGEVCKEYADKYSNIKYIKQSNAGTCAARNKGIALASGKYVAFSDHDDNYLENYLEELIDKAEKQNLDVIKCGVFYEEAYADGTIKSRQEGFVAEVLEQTELLDRYNDLPISFFGVWNSLYKRDVLVNNNVLFMDEVRYGQEDFFFNTAVIPFIHRIGFTDKCLYRHFRRINQSTSAKFYPDRIDAMAQYYLFEKACLRDLVDRKHWDVFLQVLFSRKITGVLSYIFSTSADLSDQEAISRLKIFFNYCDPKKEILPCKFFSVLKIAPKYALVLFCSYYTKYGLLIGTWKKKNKN